MVLSFAASCFLCSTPCMSLRAASRRPCQLLCQARLGKVLDCSIYAKELGKKPLIRAFAERRRPGVGKHEFNPLLLLTTTMKPAFQSVTW